MRATHARTGEAAYLDFLTVVGPATDKSNACPVSLAGGRRSWCVVLKSVLVGVVPYVIMLVGIPFFNSGREVAQLPLLGLWILVWVVLTPPFLLAAYRLLPPGERRERES